MRTKVLLHEVGAKNMAKFLGTLSATIVALGLLCPPANAGGMIEDKPGDAPGAELLPHYDVKAAALKIATSMAEHASAGCHDATRTEQERNKDCANDPEENFKASLNGQIHAQNYIAAHWSSYSEYKQLFCIQWEETTAIEHRNPPSYFGLGMCVAPIDVVVAW